MAERVIAGNWKMNTTVAEAVGLIGRLRSGLPVEGVTSVVCPPYVSLHAASEALRGTGIGLGAQDMRPEPSGALTGEVSVSMVAELCGYVILGHSERRTIFGETSESVSAKVLAALSAGLRPIVCVGETLAERESGAARDVVSGQIRASLATAASGAGLLVAYEPVWAIGTGRAASADDAQEMAAVVRAELGAILGDGAARDVPVLYGGSVTAENVAGLVAMPDVDGALVGGASLDPEGFLRLTERAAPLP